MAAARTLEDDMNACFEAELRRRGDETKEDEEARYRAHYRATYLRLRPCYYFWKLDSCRHGARCRFRHALRE